MSVLGNIRLVQNQNGKNPDLNEILDSDEIPDLNNNYLSCCTNVSRLWEKVYSSRYGISQGVMDIRKTDQSRIHNIIFILFAGNLDSVAPYSYQVSVW